MEDLSSGLGDRCRYPPEPLTFSTCQIALQGLNYEAMTDKQALFDKYHKNAVQAGINLEQSELMCPLCLELYAFDDMSIEHIVPQCLGGNDRAVVLTCRSRCNNTHGSRLDAAVFEHQKMLEGFSDELKFPVRISSDDFDVGGDFRIGKDKVFHFWPCDKRSHPNHFEHVMKNGIGEVGTTCNLNIKFPFTQNRHESGLLRCAYLAMFRKYGYAYLSMKAVDRIRAKICDWDSKDLDFANQIMSTDGELAKKANPYLITKHIKTMPHYSAIILRLKTEITRYRIILMPSNCDCSEGFFETVERINADSDQPSFELEIYESADLLGTSGG